MWNGAGFCCLHNIHNCTPAFDELLVSVSSVYTVWTPVGMPVSHRVGIAPASLPAQSVNAAAACAAPLLWPCRVASLSCV